MALKTFRKLGNMLLLSMSKIICVILFRVVAKIRFNNEYSKQMFPENGQMQFPNKQKNKNAAHGYSANVVLLVR